MRVYLHKDGPFGVTRAAKVKVGRNQIGINRLGLTDHVPHPDIKHLTLLLWSEQILRLCQHAVTHEVKSVLRATATTRDSPDKELLGWNTRELSDLCYQVLHIRLHLHH